MSEGYIELGGSELGDMLGELDKTADNIHRVINFCRQKNIDAEFIFHKASESTRDSAENLNIEERFIAKTLVFRSENNFIAVLCPGDTRVSEEKLSNIFESEVEMASPQQVKQKTGYIIGTVSPFDLDIPIYFEESIMGHEKIYPAAGSRHVGAMVDPSELKETLDAEVKDLDE